MADINVQVEERGDQYRCTVTVQEGRSQTQHTVTVDEEDYRRLTGGQVTPATLVEASFRFLLEREPKESILRSFNLMVIQRYFPEYERTIPSLL
jgi:hypothetical protein